MKVNRYGKAEALTPEQISSLFTEGLVKPRDRALFGVCLYTASRINEACTLLKGDVIGLQGVRAKLVIRCYNTKGKQETREIQIHPRLREFLEEYSAELKGKNLFLFPGRHRRGHIHKGSADSVVVSYKRAFSRHV